MTTDQTALVGLARQFAQTVNGLLNGTVANGVRLSAVLNATTGNCGVGYQLSTKNLSSPGTIPLTIGAKPASGYLTVDHRLKLDPEGIWLTNARSSYSVSRDEAGEEPMFRYDYVRSQKHHPQAHLHVHADFIHERPQGVRPPTKLHFPVGGRRFRTTLEDVIEFLIVEGIAEGRPGWESVVEECRADWNRNQLRAAVRRDPETAIDYLRSQGHI